MIIVLSPAKSLDYETPPHIKKHTLPEFAEDSAELIEGLRKLSPQQIGSLMHISDPLARLNFQRYADWSPAFSMENAKQAMLAFNGDVYEGEWKNGDKHGKGTLWSSDGSVYEGEFENGRKKGS